MTRKWSHRRRLSLDFQNYSKGGIPQGGDSADGRPSMRTNSPSMIDCLRRVCYRFRLASHLTTRSVPIYVPRMIVTYFSNVLHSPHENQLFWDQELVRISLSVTMTHSPILFRFLWHIELEWTGKHPENDSHVTQFLTPNHDINRDINGIGKRLKNKLVIIND